MYDGESHEQDTDDDELRLPQDSVEDLEPDPEDATTITGGATLKKLPGKRTPPT